MTNRDLKEKFYMTEERMFINRELYLKNFYFRSKIQQSYLRSFPELPKAFVSPINHRKFLSSLVYPEHLQYSEHPQYSEYFLYGLEFAKKLDGCKPEVFRRSLQDHAMNLYRKMSVLGINYYLLGGIDYILDKVYKTSVYVKKELLRKIFLFTLEGYLSESNIYIDFETYDNWPINKIKFTQEYKNSGKLCKEFFHSVDQFKKT